MKGPRDGQITKHAHTLDHRRTLRPCIAIRTCRLSHPYLITTVQNGFWTGYLICDKHSSTLLWFSLWLLLTKIYTFSYYFKHVYTSSSLSTYEVVLHHLASRSRSNEELLVIKNSKEVSIYQSKLCIDTKIFLRTLDIIGTPFSGKSYREIEKYFARARNGYCPTISSHIPVPYTYTSPGPVSCTNILECIFTCT